MSNFTFDPNAANEIDQSAVKTSGPQFPLIQFRKGNQNMRKAGGMEYEGGFFIPDDKGGAELGEALEAAGWVRDSFISESEKSKGDEVSGWWNKQITISVVLSRGKWIETVKNNGDKGGYSKDQYLVFVKGLEDKGLFLLTLSGHTAMSFKGVKNYYRTGVLSTLDRTLIAAANAMTKGAKWARFAFWVTVGAAEDAKHQPVFTTVGSGKDSSSIVVPVPVGMPKEAKEVDQAVLGKFYVGREFQRIANQAYQDNVTWKEWPTNGEDGESHHEDNAGHVTEKELSDIGV